MTNNQPTQTPVRQKIEAIILKGKEEQKVAKLRAAIEAKLKAN